MSLEEQLDLNSRLNFLYQAVLDTQNTIRFIDTKAAFCVTLLSGMVAGLFQAKRIDHPRVHNTAFVLFLVCTAVCLLICLRVIFPVIKPHSAPRPAHGRDLPRFFISQSHSHHWIRHALSNSVKDVLIDDHASYTRAMAGATDADLVTSMCDELLMVSLIRQIKADRLHTAMLTLIPGLLFFLVLMLS